jgi:hypothetical protein
MNSCVFRFSRWFVVTTVKYFLLQDSFLQICEANRFSTSQQECMRNVTLLWTAAYLIDILVPYIYFAHKHKLVYFLKAV